VAGEGCPKSNTWLDSWPFARCEPEGLANDVLSTSRTLDVVGWRMSVHAGCDDPSKGLVVLLLGVVVVWWCGGVVGLLHVERASLLTLTFRLSM
jgi:hypothetical protein